VGSDIFFAIERRWVFSLTMLWLRGLCSQTPREFWDKERTSMELRSLFTGWDPMWHQ